jgi:hypothetical protein
MSENVYKKCEQSSEDGLDEMDSLSVGSNELSLSVGGL